ncbi:T9SS type B sorting domain-containing protein [Flavobacterium oncorhynchi]|uniref:T9SS type B sorting domain-containing protein n=1 Tax=Flavobacterium oncorhynchi TaxID=728056 RepID=UPI003519DDC7
MKKKVFLFFILFCTYSFAQTSTANLTKKLTAVTAGIGSVQVLFEKVNNAVPPCIPNTKLTVANASNFTAYQWYFNNTPIPSATTSSYVPTQAGYYTVTAIQSSTGTSEHSNDIPVSICPLDTDNDGTNNNIDEDWDNDGITNRTESGILSINQSNPLMSSEFSATIVGNGTIKGKPYYGFVSEVPAGKTNSLTYTLNLTKPETIVFQYIGIDSPGIQITPPSEYLNNEGDFILKVPFDKTITVQNPINQILIDTNFDGVYESDVTEFTSSEIRFRYAHNNPAQPGIPVLNIVSYLTNSITFIHSNLSDININRAVFTFNKYYNNDFDSDNVPDYFDLDSDNDGIPDTIEAQGKNFKVYSGIDTNKNGLDDAFEPGLNPVYSDNDQNNYGYNTNPDYKDLDSDNDGIYDLIESGNNSLDVNNDGMIDGSPVSFGVNGFYDALETFPESGILNYIIADTDNDGIANYLDLDSDGDSCNDVTDAGFTDSNNDGVLGDTPTILNYKGLVTNKTDGYTTPNSAYLIASKISITTQPVNQSNCETQSVTFTISTNQLDGYQWQLSTNGTLWTNIVDNTNYSGSTTSSLLVKNLMLTMQNYKYRVVLSKNGNLCGLTSREAALSVSPIPSIIPTVSLIQCDDTAGGLSTFNLTEKNSFFSTNYTNEAFSYYTSLSGANTKDATYIISNPIAYSSTSGTIWVRIENSNGCFSVGELNLIVSATKIPSSYNRTFSVCDDYLDSQNDDKDGIATFNFDSVSDDLKTLLPAPVSLYSISYYNTENDALSEINKITNTTTYRNIGSPDQQKIWVRIENNLDNSCYGLGSYITLQVIPIPNIDTNENHRDDQLICSNLSTFFVKLNAGINDGTPIDSYSYIWKKDGEILPDEIQASIDVNKEGTYTVEVTSLSNCSTIRTIKVSASNVAQINKISIEDGNDSNTKTIIVDASGPGSYEYSLDNADGPFQTSSTFENVAFGVHEVYIKDINGCGLVSKSTAIVGAPKFFTPNADGYNDYWNILGLNTDVNRNSIIHIFDRYGKLIKQLKPSDIGWDGTFAGNIMPADDYWYSAKLGNGTETKGHFSLKR